MRSVGTVCLAAMAGDGAPRGCVGAVTARLFQGDDFLTVMLLLGVVLFSLVYVGRGLLGGVSWFRGYAASLCIDGVVRLPIVAPFIILASERLAAVAVVGAGIIGIGASFAARGGDLAGC